MARSIYRPRPENMVDDFRSANHYDHESSDIAKLFFGALGVSRRLP